MERSGWVLFQNSATLACLLHMRYVYEEVQSWHGLLKMDRCGIVIDLWQIDQLIEEKKNAGNRNNDRC